MPFQPCPGVAQVQLIGQQDGQQTINDLYFRTPFSPPTTLSMGDLLQAIAGWYANSIASYASVTWSFLRARVKDLSTPEGVTLEDASFATPGAVGGGAAPNNVSFAVSFRCAIGGRSARGRNYIPGIPLQALSGNTITNDFIANYVQAYTGLLSGNGVVPANWTWCVLSRIAAGQVRPAGVATACTVAIVTDNIVDSMRRRLPGRGN